MCNPCSCALGHDPAAVGAILICKDIKNHILSVIYAVIVFKYQELLVNMQVLKVWKFQHESSSSIVLKDFTIIILHVFIIFAFFSKQLKKPIAFYKELEKIYKDKLKLISY